MQVLAHFGIGQQTLRAEPQERITLGHIKFFSDNQNSRRRVILQDIREQGSGGGARYVRIDDEDSGFGHGHAPQIRSER